MTEDDLRAIEQAPDGWDAIKMVAAYRELRTRFAVAQGTATAETHRADERQARVEVLEREAFLTATMTRETIADRDAMQALVAILRACVSASLHGDWQEKANAYAALNRYDAKARDMAKEGT